MNKIIEIIVSPTGETRLETKGFTGEECREASKFVEHALGVATGEQLTGDVFRQIESLSLQRVVNGGTRQ
jgi:hypothetical protein